MFDSFAICKATVDEITAVEVNRRANPMANKRSFATSNHPTITAPVSSSALAVISAGKGVGHTAGGNSTAAGISADAGQAQATVLLKVHLYSTLEVKQTTTLPMRGGIFPPLIPLPLLFCSSLLLSRIILPLALTFIRRAYA